MKTARQGRIAQYLAEAPVLEAGAARPDAANGSQATVVVPFRLQDVADYRAAIRGWFAPVRVGGHLVIVVPHAFLYERQLALPSPWEATQRRIYTPRALLEEVEEALVPNSYRVRHLGDGDDGYDYAADDDQPPVGESEIVLVIEKIAPPGWKPKLVTEERPLKPRLPTPDYAFEPARTRVEVRDATPPYRILLVKPDHLGDFIMSLGAIERTRELFPAAEITLLVGSWNAEMARALGVADHVLPFDMFPRNSSEEEVDVPGQGALFRAAVTGEYDLAIDLRSDYDTRFLLKWVKARLKAGIGTRAQFPFLDIFLPVDFTRNEPETAREYLLNHHAFASQSPVKRSEHRVTLPAKEVERHCAIIWGPYHLLRPGRYFFDPFIELAPQGPGMLMLDVALDARRVAHRLVDQPGDMRLAFEVEDVGTRFEFRVWAVGDLPAIDFSFFGGRLIRAGADSVLHQSEYQRLLVELVAMRLAHTGVLADLRAEADA